MVNNSWISTISAIMTFTIDLNKWLKVTTNLYLKAVKYAPNMANKYERILSI